MSNLKKNTWTLNGWNDQTVADQGSYSEDDTFWAWGSNNYGALGLSEAHSGPSGKYSSPVQIPGTSWNKVAISGRHFLAIRTDGTLWAAGSNQQGELGQNKADVPGSGDTTEYSQSSPIQIPGTWSDVATGTNRSYGIKANGTLWAWGYNQHGSLGLNEQYAHHSSPAQIHGGGTDWASLATSSDKFMMAVKTDGTLWGWGEAQNTGNLGHRHSAPTGINSRSSPIQIPGTNWSQVSTTYSCVWATKTDGTLWSWGQNQNGELGHNERNPNGYSSPVQVGTNTNWSKVRAGFQMAFLTTTGNAVFAVGNGTNGQLGLNDANDRSSPTIVGGGAWKDIAGGRYTSYGIRDW